MFRCQSCGEYLEESQTDGEGHAVTRDVSIWDHAPGCDGGAGCQVTCPIERHEMEWELCGPVVRLGVMEE